MSGLSNALIGAASNQTELLYIWDRATVEAKAIIALLFVFSIAAWFVMMSKVIQMRRARKLNALFGQEFTSQKVVLEMFDRKLQVDGCPLYAVYQAGCVALDARLRGPSGERAKQNISLKNMEHIKRAIENVVAKESLKLESGLILLAIAVSGAPFMGLLGTVWGVMSTFAGIAQSPQGRFAGRHGARRFRRARHDRRGLAGGDPLDVRLQLAGPQSARVHGRTGQFRAGVCLQD